MTTRQSDCELPDEDTSSDLAAQIRAIHEKSQRALIDALENSAHASLTEAFCQEGDVQLALEQFYAQPNAQSFAQAVAGVVLLAAQRFAADLRAVESIKSTWSGTSSNVAIFEAAAYFWSMVSLAVRESIRYEFDHDKEAVVGAMLGSFSALTAIMKIRWTGFVPEEYSLSRLFYYPSDPVAAGARFCRLLMASEACLLPLPSADVAHGSAIEPLNFTEQAMLAPIRKAYDELLPGLSETVLKMVSEYLVNRLE